MVESNKVRALEKQGKKLEEQMQQMQEEFLQWKAANHRH
jgi:chaperonin cofactor prefoldin